MGLFSKKPKAAASDTSDSTFAPPAPAGKPAKGKKYAVDPVDFLALRSEMVDLRARLEASEQAKAMVENRLAALDATTTAMAGERSSDDDLRSTVADLQTQLEAVAETAASAAAAAVPTTPVEPDPALVARIDALAAHLEVVSSVSAPDPTIATRLEALTARVDADSDNQRVAQLEARLAELAQQAPAAAAEPAVDAETVARIDELSERVSAIDAFASQLSQINARVTAQAEFGAQLGSLRDRISELTNETEERRAAAVAATGDADIRDRVNALSDRLAGSEGIASQIAQLAQRVATNDTTTRQITEQVSAIEQRVNAVSTELANQVSELGRDIDGLAAHATDAARPGIDDTVIEGLKTSQVKLAAEQARYEIAFRQDLAALAEQVRRRS